MLDALFDLGRRVLLWFSNKPNRKRLRGARIEVMAFIVARSTEPSILLAQSVYQNRWMPPQEGVNLNESFSEALHRCLEVECGLDLPPDAKAVARYMHVRSYRFIGDIQLPLDRQGERPVADNAPGTAFEAVKLKSKAYWMATVVLRLQSDVDPKADGREIIDLRWFSFEEAAKAIRETNGPEKARLLLKALSSCQHDLMGGSSPEKRGV